MELTRQGWLKLLGGAAVATVALYLALRPAPVPVDVVAVGKQRLEVTVDEEGVSQVREVYLVSAPVAGLVVRSPLKIGDPVVRGETIVAKILPSVPDFLDERSLKIASARVQAAEAALKFAEANVTRAEAQLRFSKSEFERAERLVKTKIVSERAYEEAKLNVALSTAALATARAEVEVKVQELGSARAGLIGPLGADSTRDSSCCMEIRAPESGRVLRLLVESEKVVVSGTPLIEIGNPTNIEIVVDLLSKDAVRVTEGAEALLEDWGGEQTLRARVRRIESSAFTKISALGIEEQRVKVRLDPLSSPEQLARLGHDFRVFVRIVVWNKDDVLTIPVSALFRDGGEWALYTVIGSVARRQIVKLGLRNKHSAEVAAGLAAGDRVILHPGDRIRDGTVVTERSPR